MLRQIEAFTVVVSTVNRSFDATFHFLFAPMLDNLLRAVEISIQQLDDSEQNKQGIADLNRIREIVAVCKPLNVVPGKSTFTAVHVAGIQVGTIGIQPFTTWDVV